MDAIYIISANGTKTLLCSTSSQVRTMSYHKLDLELNAPGEMTITLPATNPVLSRINFMSDEITFERNGIELFRGEPCGSVLDALNTGEIKVIGALNYFSSVYMEPYEYHGSVTGYVTLLLNAYNKRVSANRRIELGNVSVTDPNDYIWRADSKRVRIFALMKDKLVGKMGGYLRIRIGNDGKRYLDYLADFGRISRQQIKYGKNLLDIEQEVEYQEVYSVIIPEGHEDDETGEALTIASVNNGSVYLVNQPAVAAYGWRETVVEWPDVTLPENLKQKAQSVLESYAMPVKSVTVKAVDMALYSNTDCFYLGDQIRTSSQFHGLEDVFLLSAMTIYSLTPEDETLTLGAARLSYTDSIGSAIRDINEQTSTIKKDNWNLSQRLQEAEGMFTTIVEGEDGSQKIMMHDKKLLNDSQLQISFSSAGIFLTADKGATWYGIEMSGNVIVRMLEAVGISADVIEGGLQVSKRKNEDGDPISWVDWDAGAFSFADGVLSFDGERFDLKQIKQLDDLYEAIAAIHSDVNGIYAEISKSYVTKDDLDTRTRDVETKIGVTAEGLEASISGVESSIKDDQTIFQDEWSRHLRFGQGGLTLDTGDGELSLSMDPENGIAFKRYGKIFGTWDGEDFHTGNIIVDVNKRAQFGNFAFIPRSDGSLMFLKVGE